MRAERVAAWQDVLAGRADAAPPTDIRYGMRCSVMPITASKLVGIPSRYLAANAFSLEGPGRDYADAVDALLSLFPPWLPFGSKPSKAGGIMALIGPRGTGKTHMACGLVNAFNCVPDHLGRADNGSWRWARYRRALDIFSDLKATFGRRDGDSQAGIVADLVECNLLVIDEVQVRSDSAWENSILTNLVDQRYSECRSTVLISNLNAPAFLQSVGDSIASRISECGGIIEARWQSFRTPGAGRGIEKVSV